MKCHSMKRPDNRKGINQWLKVSAGGLKWKTFSHLYKSMISCDLSPPNFPFVSLHFQVSTMSSLDSLGQQNQQYSFYPNCSYLALQFHLYLYGFLSVDLCHAWRKLLFGLFFKPWVSNPTIPSALSIVFLFSPEPLEWSHWTPVSFQLATRDCELVPYEAKHPSRHSHIPFWLGCYMI